MAKIGETIRVLRIKRGYSQAQLAEMIGMKRSAISNYEQGIREPDLDTIEAFADFFDVSIADLIGRNESKPVVSTADDDELMRDLESIRRDPERRKLFKHASNMDLSEVREANAILDALKKTRDGE